VIRRQAEGSRFGPREVQRLREEGRALAELNHPGIATVFDAQEHASDDVVFVVMEHVDGPSLQRWLQARARDTTEIIARFVACAEALQAAHAVGVLHRDFKPDNVMLRADGRPVVLDFGGLGTPAYMPPEQARGDPLDVRADVYSWCASLGAALEGRDDVPRRVLRLLRRGLAERARDRPASMGAVLAAVRPRSTALRVGLLALGVVAVAASVTTEPAPGEECTVARELVEPPVLPPDSKATADAYRAAWNDAALALCREPEVAGAAADCLQRLDARWRGTVESLRRNSSAAQATLLLTSLPAPSGCITDPGHVPPWTDLEARLESLFAEVVASRRFGGWLEEGPDLARRMEEIQSAAITLGAVGVEARATMLLGLFEFWAIELEQARVREESAYALAQAADRPDIELLAAGYLVQLTFFIGGDREQGELWLERARQAVVRIDDDDARIELATLEGEFSQSTGDCRAALVHYERALQLAAPEQDPMKTLDILTGRARCRLTLQRPEDALVDVQRGLELVWPYMREDTLEVADALNTLALTLRQLDRMVEAAAIYERLIRLYEREQPGTPDVAGVRGNLAQLYADQGRYADALRERRKVRSAFEDFGGAGHPAVILTSAGIASDLLELGQHADALREAQRVLATEAVPQHQAGLLEIVGKASRALGDRQAAREAFAAVLELDSATDEQRSDAREQLSQL